MPDSGQLPRSAEASVSPLGEVKGLRRRRREKSTAGPGTSEQRALKEEELLDDYASSGSEDDGPACMPNGATSQQAFAVCETLCPRLCSHQRDSLL
jgi:hypothetical protein